MRLLFFLIVLSFNLAAMAASNPQNESLACEVRWFCHDIGMPRDEDETSHYRSVFLVPNQAGRLELHQTYTYDYGSVVPEVRWSSSCENYKLKMQRFFKIDSRTECAQINNDGSVVIPWH